MQTEAKAKKPRSSNLELLRILCMLFIIGDHFTGQSGVVEVTDMVESLFYCSTTSMSRVSCTVFIIISAWFSVGRPFKFRRIVHVWLTAFLLAVPITLYCMSIGIAGKDHLFTALLPVLGNSLWFVSCYIIITMFSPLFNYLLEKAPKRLVEYFLAVAFLLVVIYPTLLAQPGLFPQEIYILSCVYIFTGYVRKYVEVLPSLKKSCYTFMGLWLFITLARATSAYYHDLNPHIMDIVMRYGEFYRAQLCTLPNLVMAYTMFFIFLQIKMKTYAWINVPATATLGIYCYHQVPAWYDYYWKHVFASEYFTAHLHGWERMAYTLCSILLVYLIGFLLENIRSRISAFLIEDREFCKTLCLRIDDYVNGTQTAPLMNTRSIGKILFFCALYITIAKKLC